MERIFALAPIPTIVLDPSYRILEVSQTYLDILHARIEDCQGLDFVSCFKKKTSASNLPLILKVVEDAVATQSTQSTDTLLELDGQRFWRLSAVPIVRASELLYLVLEAHDETKEYLDRQAINNQLAAAEIFRVLVSTVKDYAIFMLDTDGHVVTWNAGAAILKQYSEEEIIGKHFSQFYSGEDRRARKPEKELQRVLRDGKVEDEGWRIRKDGSRFWANVIISPIYQNSVLTGYSKVTRDLTERKAAEGRLIAAYEEASRMKSEFLANMSHEIRTPMHGMLSALSLLMDTSLTKEQQELTGIIEDSGSILLQVINDILDYSKLASGSFSITTEVINIADIVSAVQRCFKVGSKTGLRLDVEHDPRVPVIALGDPLRYRQILQNLVSNAIKFTDEGYVRVTTILSGEDETSYTVKSEVKDTGIGVPPQAVSSLFNPFTQLDTFVTKRYKGTGLGLSICKSLAELMGGMIGYRPNPEGHGSIFYFTMKVAKLENSTAHPLSVVVPSTNINAVAQNKQLLLVEDNAINQTVMVRLLRSFGFENVDVARNGAEGVQLVKQKPLTYDLLLMDISMPVLDGLSATKQIRQMGLDVPIIAMTANALQGDADSYLAGGMSDYIAKPVVRRLLIQALLRWLK